MVSPVYFIALPLGAAFLTVLIGRSVVARVIAILAGLGLTALAGTWVSAGLDGAVDVVIAAVKAPLGIQLAIDPLSAVMVLLVSVSALLIILYSQSYIGKHSSQTKYYTVLMLLLAASFGLLLTRDLFNLFVFYEILCISSYILVSWEQNDAALEASMKYMILGSVGSLFMLVAIGLAYRVSGSLAMNDIAAAMASADGGYVILTAALFLFGMGIEAAIFPVNTWLPDAHSSAPSSISAVLSGFVIELALVVLYRVSTLIFASVNLLPVFTFVALAGVVVGELAAYGQSELKRTLAYSSIGQIGIMFFALSMGTEEALRAGVSHLVMHAGAKSALFLIAGYFILRTGSRNIEDYRGLSRRMPESTILFTLAALSLIGVPPLFGFFTKFGIVRAAAAAGGPAAWSGIVVILFGTAVEAAYLFRVVRTLYSRPVGTEEVSLAGTEEVSYTDLDTPAMIAVLAFTALVVFGVLLLPVVPAFTALY